MLAAPSDSRNAAVAATSSGRTSRLMGGMIGGVLARAGSCNIGVSMAPGAMMLTVICRAASSEAIDLENPISADLDAA